MTGAIEGVVLAGGRSTRFGSDKAWAVLGGRPLLQWVVEALAARCARVVVVRARGQVLPPVVAGVPVAVVDDEYEARGPLAGLVTGLGAVATELCFVASCDAPLLRPELIDLLAGTAGGAEPGDAAVARVGGMLQPLAAVYRPRACLAPFRETLETGRPSLLAALARVHVTEVAEAAVRAVDPALASFAGANTPDALAALEAILHEQ